MAWAVSVLAAGTVVAGTARGQSESPSSPKPATQAESRPAWDMIDTSDVFFENAFDEPFQGKLGNSATPPSLPEGLGARRSAADASPLGEGSEGVAGGFFTSRSLTCLEQEIKGQSELLLQACRNPAHFAARGHAVAYDAFQNLALAFAVLDATRVPSRLTPRAGAAARYFREMATRMVPTDPEAFGGASLARERLVDLLNGDVSQWADSPADRPPLSVADVVDLSDRAVMMRRMETGLQRILAGVASERSFRKEGANLAFEGEVLAVVGDVLRAPEAIDGDDPVYADLANAYQTAIDRFGAAMADSNFAAAERSARLLRGTCTRCHESYR